MTQPAALTFGALDIDTLAEVTGRIGVIVDEDAKLDIGARRINKLMRGALKGFVESDAFAKMNAGEVRVLHAPLGLIAEAVIVLRLPKRPESGTARKAGAALAKIRGKGAMTVLTAGRTRIEDLALGIALRGYAFTDHKSDPEAGPEGAVHMVVSAPEAAEAAYADKLAQAEGVFFTRDLVNAPANVLPTTKIADDLAALSVHGLDVDVMEEAELEDLGMGSLLCVGQGSDSPSKVVVMKWMGGEKDTAPLALVGKGVVFDTGGISLKPAAGMEDMTMDMGGAGVVAGVMKTLALRKARANVVGLVGLVENMPSGNATRPGDVVTSMKGDTIEVINTDAEGRLVLADVLWYAQETFKPAAVIDLATLTGAIIIGLGHDNAGVFSNDDRFCADLLKAAASENEGAWRMPLGSSYDALLKSRIADMKNIGGRPAGSITAAQFLQRFIKEGTPWAHIDIAGVASISKGTDLSPAGATGWGVRTLDRLVADVYETKD